ncbi:MAG TPA: IS200/IS605 family transposase [Planctomycetaceae bacterium]|nr:IS200/IS605 family transposase [Planctomycetaceae bacterium]
MNDQATSFSSREAVAVNSPDREVGGEDVIIGLMRPEGPAQNTCREDRGMAGRFVCNLVHFVWSTHHRTEWIAEAWEERLFAYLGGIARRKNASLIAAGGMPDHLHLLVSMPPTVSVSDMVSTLKSNSSRWIHDEIPGMKSFKWQEGYGEFSVSRSNEAVVVRYIRHQKEHHTKRNFQTEFLDFLKRHQVEYDPEYIWK